MTDVKKTLKLFLIAVLFIGISGAFLQAGAEGKVNVNTATSEQLTSLKGIGPVIAQRIVDYRQENGRFASMDQLQEVKGIGPKTLSEIADQITVAPASD